MYMEKVQFHTQSNSFASQLLLVFGELTPNTRMMQVLVEKQLGSDWDELCDLCHETPIESVA